MELINLPSVALLAVLLLLLLVQIVKSRNRSSRSKRPPGPPGWPVFGNMFDLGELPHQTLNKFKRTYGPLVWLKLGSVNTLFVQSPTAAAELFKKHDSAFCDRKVPDALTALDFHQVSLGICNYGSNWRTMRRLCTSELLDNKKMNETTELRKRMVESLVRWIEEDATTSLQNGGTGEVQINNFLFLMAFNLVGNLMLSRDLLDPKDPRGHEFFECTNTFVELTGTPNIADFFPVLKRIDPLSIKKSMVKNLVKTINISSKFVQERLQERASGKKNNRKDFLDALLDYRGDGKDGPDVITEKNTNILIMEMFTAGSETTSITLEWGFTELLRNPEVFRKTREEIDRVVGIDKKVEETDIDNLPYLQAVIKENLRLHPALPLLLPRNTMEDTHYMGYDIPKGTQVFVNAWSIGRDPDTWEDPLTFKPERFLDSNIEYRGQHFEFIPFGSGRRICVGFPLAHRLIPLTIATLVQSFDWELPNGVTPETLNMEEKLALTLRKKTPVKAIPKLRFNGH